MKLFLTTIENTSYKGQKTLALCTEDGRVLPHGAINIATDNASGVTSVTATFKVDGTNVAIR